MVYFFSSLILQFKIQKKISQHKDIARIHPSSINTIRVMTLRKNEEIYFLSAVIRFGSDGSKVDNVSMGGVSVGISEEGYLNSIGFTSNGSSMDKHPYTNIKFNGTKIPNYKNAIDFLLKQHKKLVYFDLVSWDIVISPDENPIIIEYNIHDQGIDLLQFNNGPLFGEHTDYILNKIKK